VRDYRASNALRRQSAVINIKVGLAALAMSAVPKLRIAARSLG
jgi:hypothetical protein